MHPPRNVAFLMAAEIQRLVNENHELKVQVKALQDLSLDRINYEMQIRDLMARIQSQDEELFYLRNDNDRLTKLLRDLESTIQKYEAQLKGYDPNWRKELESAKKELGRLQKKIGDDDVDSLRDQLNQLKKKCATYEDRFGNPEDLQRMLDEYKKKAQQFDDLNRKLNGIDPATLIKKMKDFDKLSKALGCDPDDLLKELERLKQKAKEADDLKRELGQSRQNLGELDGLRRQGADLKSQNDLLSRQLRELQLKLADTEKKLQEALNELQIVKDALRKRDQELASLGNQLRDLQKQQQDWQRQLQDLNGKLRQAESEKARLQGELVGLQDEMEGLLGSDEKLNDLQDQMGELQGQKDQLEEKLDDLLRQMAEKDRLIQELRDQLERKNGELRDCQAKLKDTQKQLKDANDKIEWIKNEFGLTDDDLDPKKRKANGSNAKELLMFKNVNPINQLLNYLLVSAENERLQVVIQQYFADNQGLANQIAGLEMKCKQLGNQNSELLQIQTRYQSQEQDIQKIREQYENKIVMLTMEVSRLKQQAATGSSQQLKISGQQHQIKSCYELDQRRSSEQISEELEGAKRKVSDLLCLVVMMSAEIDSLRNAGNVSGLAENRSSEQLFVREKQNGLSSRSSHDLYTTKSTTWTQQQDQSSASARQKTDFLARPTQDSFYRGGTVSEYQSDSQQGEEIRRKYQLQGYKT